MVENKELTKIETKLAKIEPQFPALDKASENLRELVKSDNGSPSHAIRQAAAIETVRQLLTPEVMAPIMALQGTPLGFLTDKDNQSGYSDDVVRDVTLECIGRGGQMTANRTNIIASRYYATKWQFADWLDKALGRGNWYFCHHPPRTIRGEKMKKDKRSGKYSKQENAVLGAIVKTVVHWCIGGKWYEQELEHAIKGDEYATADAYNGKADRKCGSWLYVRVTGEHVPETDDDTIDVQATQVEEENAEPEDAKQARDSVVSAFSTEADDPIVQEVQKFLSNFEARGITPEHLDAYFGHSEFTTEELRDLYAEAESPGHLVAMKLDCEPEFVANFLSSKPANYRFGWVTAKIEELKADKALKGLRAPDELRDDLNEWLDKESQ